MVFQTVCDFKAEIAKNHTEDGRSFSKEVCNFKRSIVKNAPDPCPEEVFQTN